MHYLQPTGSTNTALGTIETIATVEQKVTVVGKHMHEEQPSTTLGAGWLRGAPIIDALQK